MRFSNVLGQKWVRIAALLIIYDIIVINLAYGAALWLRFDLKFSMIPEEYLHAWVSTVPAYTVLSLVIFVLLKLYRSVWRFVSYNEMMRVAAATMFTAVVQVILTELLFTRMPVLYYIGGAMIQFLAMCGVRFSYRALRIFKGFCNAKAENTYKRVMIVGAGEAGRMLLREIRVENPKTSVACCLVDDNPNKRGRILENVKIEGSRRDIKALVKKHRIDRIIIAMPSASAERRKAILDICKETGCELKMLPGISQILNGQATLAQLRDVSVEELLGREPVKTDMTEIAQYINGKIVMVTGGGGSIGSELARQIASYGPRCLILFDIYENNVYSIQQELKWHYPDLILEVIIGSVRDEARVRQVMKRYSPDIVYHAAAHKHVPLMERSPNEAIKNNVLGTYVTAKAAAQYGVRRFVLISTDKAVNPTNIMGASKRLCEMIVQEMDRRAQQTSFVAVRFGNVLGSNCSVIPLFKRQIAAGGPVTVTHPEITRFFMTIPEAVSLVLQAGAYATGGEIFVLDMGQPVRIDELARNLIFLSGRVPGEDIEIKYTGLRPGEKLYEELLMSEEGLQRTANEKIFIGHPIELCDDLFARIEELGSCATDNDSQIKLKVASLVSTYQPDMQNEGDAGTILSPGQSEPGMKTMDLDLHDRKHKLGKAAVQTG